MDFNVNWPSAIVERDGRRFQVWGENGQIYCVISLDGQDLPEPIDPWVAGVELGAPAVCTLSFHPF